MWGTGSSQYRSDGRVEGVYIYYEAISVKLKSGIMKNVAREKNYRLAWEQSSRLGS